MINPYLPPDAQGELIGPRFLPILTAGFFGSFFGTLFGRVFYDLLPVWIFGLG